MYTQSAAIGISMPSLETLFLIICPIGMVGMMYMMHRDNQGKGNACCDSEKSVEEPIDENNNEAIGGSKQPLSKPQQPGSLEA